jgi:hypothetical protein
MAKFERTAVSLGATPGNPFPGHGTERQEGVVDPTSPARLSGPRRIPHLPPPAGPFDPGHGPEAIPSRGSMTVKSAQRERRTAGGWTAWEWLAPDAVRLGGRNEQPFWMPGLTLLMALELRPRASAALPLAGVALIAVGVGVVIEPGWMPVLLGTA